MNLIRRCCCNGGHTDYRFVHINRIPLYNSAAYRMLLLLCTSGHYAMQAAELPSATRAAAASHGTKAKVRAGNHWTVVPEVFWGTEIGIELRNGVNLNY